MLCRCFIYCKSIKEDIDMEIKNKKELNLPINKEKIKELKK
jgi:hypothetical protein